MQRTGRRANISSKPSTERSSACLNLSEWHFGHSCLIQSSCGTHAGHLRSEKFMLDAPRAEKPLALRAKGSWAQLFNCTSSDIKAGDKTHAMDGRGNSTA